MRREYSPPPAGPIEAPHDRTHLQRNFPRAVIGLSAQYAVEGEAGWQGGIIDDLGGGGVRLQTAGDVVPGSTVSLRFVIDGTPIVAKARIAMALFDPARATFVYGAAFTTINPAHREAIVRRVLALQSEAEPYAPPAGTPSAERPPMKP